MNKKFKKKKNKIKNFEFPNLLIKIIEIKKKKKTKKNIKFEYNNLIFILENNKKL